VSTPLALSSIALVWRSVCGVTRLGFSDGLLATAVAACFETTVPSQALGKSWGGRSLRFDLEVEADGGTPA
jgi:hypothetical protein